MTRITLFVALTAAGAMSAQAADAPYYNPANTASQSQLTTGHELYRTIGCPGRQLLDPVCKEPAAPADGDKDGVIDSMDKCPTTPAGRKVDAQGCEIDSDSDNDGVLDTQDKCPTTPAGRKVNADGCELDGDQDGVIDALDQCPTTAAGRKVDHRGCDIDSDNDGVPNVLDNCPNTPAGLRVNEKGCEPDGDNDGVPDSLDQCPTTPAGDKVDAKGCTLMETITLQGVVFNLNSDTLRPESFAILDNAAEVLKRHDYPMTEVAGHTDDIGNDGYNLKLSDRRAQAVMCYLTDKGVPAANLSAKGYGETAPIAENTTEAGRLANRRVELRIVR